MKTHGDHITHAVHELKRQHPGKHGHAGGHHMLEQPHHSSHEHGTYKPGHEEKRVQDEVRIGGGSKSGPKAHDGEPKGRHQDASGISESEQSGTMRRVSRMP